MSDLGYMQSAFLKTFIQSLSIIFLHSPTLNSWSELTEQSWPGYLLATLEVPHKLCQQIQLMNAL